MRIKMLQAVGDYAKGAVVPVDDLVGRRYVAAGFAEAASEDPPPVADPLIARLLRDAECQRVMGTPLVDMARDLGCYAERMAGIAEREWPPQHRDIVYAEFRGLARRAAVFALACLQVVEAMRADEGRDEQ